MSADVVFSMIRLCTESSSNTWRKKTHQGFVGYTCELVLFFETMLDISSLFSNFDLKFIKFSPKLKFNYH